MLRGVSVFPAVMKILGHTSREMTMRNLDVMLTDPQREFELARFKPRHLAPQRKARLVSFRTGLDGVIDSLLAARHVLEMFRRTLPNGTSRPHASSRHLKMSGDWPVEPMYYSSRIISVTFDIAVSGVHAEPRLHKRTNASCKMIPFLHSTGSSFVYAHSWMKMLNRQSGLLHRERQRLRMHQVA